MTQDSQYPQAQQPPAKRHVRRLLIFVGIVGAIVILVVAGTQGADTPGSGPTGAPAGNEAANQQAATETEYSVTYQVSGTSATASTITYSTDGAMTINQESNVALPWEKVITLPRDEALLVVQVTAQGDNTGTVDVRILVDNELFKEAHADGYAVASASGSIGTMG